MVTTVLTPTAPAGWPPRRAPWQSPDDQPAYVRPVLLVIVMLAALLYAWGISTSPFHSFYADAVRSMSESWKAFFFGSFDPANSITIDKLPGFLWPQALSARLFGFHSWALTLPQVLEGVASVVVLYRVVRRWMGVNAALLASGAFLCIPAADGLFRTQTEDPMFTLCVLLAAGATQRAAHSGRLRSLIMAGVWVGIGFQAKMLEAWAVLPALAVVYLVTAPAALRKRIVHVLLAAVVTVAVSSVWVVAVALTPAKDRPYIDGTTNNSAFSMVVGYNFLNRFSSVGLNASDTGSISATQGGGHRGGFGAAGGEGHFGQLGAGQYGGGHVGGGLGGGLGGGSGQYRTGNSGSGYGGSWTTGAGGAFGGYHRGMYGGGQADGAHGDMNAAAHSGGGFGAGENGWGKMFGSALASQTGWLYPLAALATVCGLVWRRRAPRTDKIRAGFLLWGVWLVTYFLVFSAGAVSGHTYYMGVIAVPCAALAGGGVALMWRAYRAGGPRAWALPVAVGATAVWSAYISSQFPSFQSWLAPASIVLGLGSVIALAVGRPGRRPVGRGRVAIVGLLVGLVSMLVAPAAWASQVFASSSSMTSMMGSVGPSSGFGGGSGGGRFAAMTDHGASRGGRSFGGFGGSSTQLDAQQQQLLDYTAAHKGSSEYDFATNSWSTASPYIVDTGANVLAMGGFTGQVPFPSLPAFQQLVNSGKLNFVLVGGESGMGAFFGGGTSDASTPAAKITNWVKSNCSQVPAKDYAGTTTAVSGQTTMAGGSQGQTLYQCTAEH
ncbi:glycosyltransferase family 39 protein [Streptomyces sp. RB6PN25]|uniref:Glycosyltransferase family 39 protein n=1 Tax=Streptomyces humicola TaxID=2953240 RepID=A0ABT1Q218_9ACTN|nr:glycosyltransferase family 39 protein [Streptomyces humicola]MCQ4083970.1 glycosyltransferase family 39 protein [Streptomyces humicola]